MIFYEDCFPFIGQDKPDAITVLPIPSSHAIDQPNDVSLELPFDNIMPVPNNADSDPLTLEQSSNTTRRSLRQTHKPSKHKDFHVSYSSSTIASYFASTCLYPLNSVLSYRKLSPSYHNIVLSITQSLEPRSYNEASKDPIWVEAMNAEIKALELNDT